MEYDYIVLQKRGVKVYNIPPMASNQGHMLDSWKSKISELDIKIIGKGQKCSVNLFNSDGTLFASAPIPENYEQAVVKCADSSRGFALRLQDPSGKTAWVGLVFPERNDSFDFSVALQDFAKNRDMEVNPDKYKAENEPTHDFALKKGEKISFNVAGGAGAAKPKPAGGSGGFGGAFPAPPGSGGFGFPPPPGSGGFGTSAPTGFPKPPTTSAPSGNNFDSFAGFNPKPSAPTTATTATASSDFGGFGGFGGFGSFPSQPPVQTQPQGNSFDLLGGFGGPSGNPAPTQTNNTATKSDQFDLL